MAEDSGLSERELAAQALCKSEGTGQCAAICLSQLSGGKCIEAASVWGRKVDAVLAALAPIRAAEKRKSWVSGCKSGTSNPWNS